VAPIDEFNSSGKQSALRDREVVDLKGHHRTFAEKSVVLVFRAVDMHFGAVLQLEPSGRSIDGQNLQSQHVSIELVHSLELLSPCSQPAKAHYFHSSLKRCVWVCVT
jgi:hypothetical protein